MAVIYQNRVEAGRILAAHLQAYADRPDVLVLALPRGGVPVGFVIATTLHLPLDVFLVRKLGVPGEEELAMGAIATGNVRVLNHEVIQALHLSEETIERVAQQEQHELARRERLYRDERPPLDVRARTVILVDDGLATGASMRAAVEALRKQQPAHIVVAVPLAAPIVCEFLRAEVDEVICPHTPDPLHGIGWWYQDFAQVSDEEVHTLLTQAAQALTVAEHQD